MRPSEKMIKRCLAGLCSMLLVACADKMPQAEKEGAAAGLVGLFFDTCVSGLGDGRKVAATAERQGFRLLAAAERKSLPFGMLEADAVQVWVAEKGGVPFYLTLNPEGCGMKTAVADEETVRRLFVGRLPSLPKQGLVFEWQSEHYSPTPFPFTRLTYAAQTGEAAEVLLTANTSPSELLPAQAALHLARRPVEIRRAVSN